MSNKSESFEEYVSSSSEEESEISNIKLGQSLNTENSAERLKNENFSIVCFPIVNQRVRIMKKKEFKKFDTLKKAFSDSEQFSENLFYGYMECGPILIENEKKKLKNNTRLKFFIWIGDKALLKSIVVVFKDSDSQDEDSYCNLGLRDNLDDVHIEGISNDTNEFLVCLKAMNDLSRITHHNLYNLETLENKFEYILEKPRRQKQVFAKMLEIVAMDSMQEEGFKQMLLFMADIERDSLGGVEVGEEVLHKITQTMGELMEKGEIDELETAQKKTMFKFFLNLIYLIKDVKLNRLFRLIKIALSVFSDGKRQKQILKAIETNLEVREKDEDDEMGKLSSEEERTLLSGLLIFRVRREDLKFIDKLIGKILRFFFRKKIKERKLDLIKDVVKFWNGLLSVEEAESNLSKMVKKVLDLERENDATKIEEILRRVDGKNDLILRFLNCLICKIGENTDDNDFQGELIAMLVRQYGGGDAIGLLLEIEKACKSSRMSFNGRMELWPSLEKELAKKFDLLFESSENKDEFWEFIRKIHELEYCIDFLNKKENMKWYRMFTIRLRVEITWDVQSNDARYLKAFFEDCQSFPNLSIFLSAYKKYFLLQKASAEHFQIYLKMVSKYLGKKQEEEEAKTKESRRKSKYKQVLKAQTEAIEKVLQHFSGNSELFLTLKSLEFINFCDEVSILKKHLVDFSVQIQNFDDKIYTNEFWNQLLELRSFKQQKDVIVYGLNTLNDKLARPEELTAELGNKFFDHPGNRDLDLLYGYFQNLKKMYQEYLQKGGKGESESQDYSDYSESDEEGSRSSAELVLRPNQDDKFMFLLLNLASDFMSFDLLKKILSNVSSRAMREKLMNQDHIRPFFTLADRVKDGLRFDFIVFVQVFKVDKLFKNHNLFLNKKNQGKCLKSLKSQREKWAHHFMKIKFATKLMNQKFFLRIVKIKFLNKEKSKIKDELRKKRVDSIKVIHTKKSKQFLDKASVWFESKLYNRFLPVYLYIEGYQEIIQNKMLKSDIQIITDLVENHLQISDIPHKGKWRSDAGG